VGTSSIQLLTGHYADASLPWLATRPKFQGSIFTNQMPFLLPNQKYHSDLLKRQDNIIFSVLKKNAGVKHTSQIYV